MILTGLQGSNPLAFLCAVGTARLCQLTWPANPIQLRWLRRDGWRPELLGVPLEREEFCDFLQQHAPWVPLDSFHSLGKNLTVPSAVFEPVAKAAARNAFVDDRRAADFVAAFACELFEDDNGRVEYSDLSFVTGSGHQDFLGTIRDLEGKCRAEHLLEALFGPWKYRDERLSLRWDPDDAKEYALRWRNPSKSGGVVSVWGATRLAFEALPLLAVIPTSRGVQTTGFATRQRAHEFTWPLWTQPASVDTIRSLLALSELSADRPDRSLLGHMGIDEIFRVARVRIGQGANFKVSFRPARSA